MKQWKLLPSLCTELVTTDAEYIEVVSVFWYGYSHCYALESAINSWQKSLPDDVQFTRMPGFFRSNLWQTRTQLYYTVRDLELPERIHAQIFSEIHHRRNPLEDSEQMAAFLHREFIIEPVQFMQSFNASEVRNLIQ